MAGDGILERAFRDRHGHEFQVCVPRRRVPWDFRVTLHLRAPRGRRSPGGEAGWRKASRAEGVEAEGGAPNWRRTSLAGLKG